MSGHSKWHSIRHKKGVTDAKRGKIFTKLMREIITAARLGGGDPASNPRLRTAIAAAKAENMPKENIERAIKKGTGEIEGEVYEELTYEGYGPGGVAVLIKALTDNRNRTTGDIRRIFSRNNGTLGDPGCVSWMFKKKGLILVNKDDADEDALMEIVLDAGAEDMSDEGSMWEIRTAPEDFEKVREALSKAGIKMELAEITMIPQTTVKLHGKEAEQTLKLLEALEDSDEIQKVYANFDIPEQEMEKITSSAG